MLCLPDVLNSSILDVFQNDPYPSVFQNDPYPVFQNDPGPPSALGEYVYLVCMFFGPGHPFCWTCTCFLDLAGFFCGPGGTKNVGDVPVCFLGPVGIFFLDLHVFVLDPGTFFRPPN